jgi:hypothetical protein
MSFETAPRRLVIRTKTLSAWPRPWPLLGRQDFRRIAYSLRDPFACCIPERHQFGTDFLESIAVDRGLGEQVVGLLVRGPRLVVHGLEVLYGGNDDGAQLILLLRRGVDLDREVLNRAVGVFLDRRGTVRAPHEAAVMPAALGAKAEAAFLAYCLADEDAG